MPLDGIRVLDWSIWQAGGMASVLLGALGAEVIKIESKTGDPSRHIKQLRGIPVVFEGGLSLHHQVYNRNKKGIALDLKPPLGREIMYRLVKKSDVFVSGFSPEADRRLSIDYETLSRFNSRLVYAKTSGFGRRGPDAAKPAMDLAGIARSGLAMVCGEADAPPDSIRGGIADEATAVMTTLGVLAGLMTRERGGKGQEIHVSMLGSMVHLLEIAVGATLNFGEEMPREGQADAHNPLWNCYQCRDGKWIALSHFDSEDFWPSFCKVVGIAELEGSPQFKDVATRGQNYRELIKILDQVFLTKNSDVWLSLLGSANLIATPVNTIGGLASDPQVIVNNYVVEMNHPVAGKIKVGGAPIEFSDTPMDMTRCRAPYLGEHTDEVLKTVAEYSDSEIAQLRSEGVIA